VPREGVREEAAPEAATMEAAIQEEATTAEAITRVAVPGEVTTGEGVLEAATTAEVITGTEVGITTMAEVRESSLADTSGSPTITHTVTPITTRTGMRIPLTPIRMTNLKYTLNRNSLLTGITVGIRKGITRTSQVVRAGGREWLRLHLPREGRVWQDEMATGTFIVLSYDDDRRVCNNADGAYCQGHAGAGKAL